MPPTTDKNAESEVDAILQKHEPRRMNLIPMLQDLQQEKGYLPADDMERVAEHLNVPVADIYAVATFYAGLSLERQGEHVISVCMGTACHVKGAPRILEALQQELGLDEDQETTDDLKFTVTSVRCLGCCGLAPAIMINEETRGHVTPEDVPEILAEYD